ncbi:PspC domain-containing protein [Bacteroidota bacterium]
MNNRLYRSRKNRVIGGVAGGLAEYIKIDPVLVRIIFIAIILIKGVGVILYVILWIVIPEEEVQYTTPDTNTPEKPESKEETSKKSGFEGDSLETQFKKPNHGKTFFGLLLIIVGVIFLFENLIPFFDLVDIFPILMLVIGIALLWNSLKK